MKQNLQPPATPLEMLSLFFPAGLLDYFDLVNHVSQETYFLFLRRKAFHSSRAFPFTSTFQRFLFLEIEVQDFPVRGKAVYLRIKRRRWEDPKQDKLIVVIELISLRYCITAEFGAFLKALLRQSCGLVAKV